MKTLLCNWVTRLCSILFWLETLQGKWIIRESMSVHYWSKRSKAHKSIHTLFTYMKFEQEETSGTRSQQVALGEGVRREGTSCLRSQPPALLASS